MVKSSRTGTMYKAPYTLRRMQEPRFESSASSNAGIDIELPDTRTQAATVVAGDVKVLQQSDVDVVSVNTLSQTEQLPTTGLSSSDVQVLLNAWL